MTVVVVNWVWIQHSGGEYGLCLQAVCVCGSAMVSFIVSECSLQSPFQSSMRCCSRGVHMPMPMRARVFPHGWTYLLYTERDLEAHNQNTKVASSGILGTGHIFLATFVISKNRTAREHKNESMGEFGRYHCLLPGVVKMPKRNAIPPFFKVPTVFFFPGNWCFPSRHKT